MAFLKKLFTQSEPDPDKPKKYQVEYVVAGKKGNPIVKAFTIKIPPSSEGKVALEAVQQVLGKSNDNALFVPAEKSHFRRRLRSVDAYVDITKYATKTREPAGHWLRLDESLASQDCEHILRYEPIMQSVIVHFLGTAKKYAFDMRKESHHALSQIIKQENLWHLAPHLILCFDYPTTPPNYKIPEFATHYITPTESLQSQLPFFTPIGLAFVSYPPYLQLANLTPPEIHLLYADLSTKCEFYGVDNAVLSEKQTYEHFTLQIDALQHQIEQGDYSEKRKKPLTTLLKKVGLDSNAERDKIWNSYRGTQRLEGELEFLKKWASHRQYGYQVWESSKLFRRFDQRVTLAVNTEGIVTSGKYRATRKEDWGDFSDVFSVVATSDDEYTAYTIEQTVIKFGSNQERLHFVNRANESVVSYIWACHGVRVLRGLSSPLHMNDKTNVKSPVNNSNPPDSSDSSSSSDSSGSSSSSDSSGSSSSSDSSSESNNSKKDFMPGPDFHLPLPETSPPSYQPPSYDSPPSYQPPSYDPPPSNQPPSYHSIAK